MTNTSIYQDISRRADGNIYIGVVGPARTGKSSFIRRFMDVMVFPNMTDPYEKTRVMDELPQSGEGKTITTTEPKFIPPEAVAVRSSSGAEFSVRLVDCVGYLIPGVLGLNEGEESRMVRTPWFEHDIPFEEAAEIGTRKVIQEHSTIGVVVTTDGSIVDMPRSAYVEAEERVIRELKALGKPFIIVLNSKLPDSPEARRVQDALTERYGVPVHAVDVLGMQLEDVNGLLESVLFEFPLREVRVHAPSWLTSLADDHWLGKAVSDSVLSAVEGMRKVRDHEKLRRSLEENEYTEDVLPGEICLNDGTVEYRLTMKDGLFYRILGEASGQEIEGEEHLFELMKELVAAKREYDRVADALDSVRTTGYGMVAPSMEELELKEPEMVKQGSHFGVRLKASAPSLHMIRVDIQTEVNPIVGTEKQSAELVQYLLSEFENNRTGIWDTEIFGKSLNDLVREGLSSKLMRMPEDVRGKIQESLQKIINEGSGGMICILL